MDATREWYPELPSTQDRAIELARSGADEGTRVVAARQRAGRGRYGHTWESPEGGLYLSIVLAGAEQPWPLLPVALGALLAEGLGHRYSLPLRVKWPNDVVLVEGRGPVRKLGGLLVDRVVSPRFGWAEVVGIGINVATRRADLPAYLKDRAVTLIECSRRPPDLEEVETVAVEAALGLAVERRDSTGAARLRELSRRQLWGVGRRASLDGRPIGLIVGLGDEGELLVEDGGARTALWSGVLEVESLG